MLQVECLDSDNIHTAVFKQNVVLHVRDQRTPNKSLKKSWTLQSWTCNTMQGVWNWYNSREDGNESYQSTTIRGWLAALQHGPFQFRLNQNRRCNCYTTSHILKHEISQAQVKGTHLRFSHTINTNVRVWTVTDKEETAYKSRRWLLLHLQT